MSTLWPHLAGWTEPDEDDWRNAKPNKFGKSPAELYGNVKDVDEYFQGAPSRPTPWKQQGQYKHLHSWDKDAVSSALSKPPVLEDVDPRILRSTQASIIRPALKHYTDQAPGDDQTFADHDQAGNRHPVVFHDTDRDEHVLLSGHHRAAKALFAGHPLRARVIHGRRTPR